MQKSEHIFWGIVGLAALYLFLSGSFAPNVRLAAQASQPSQVTAQGLPSPAGSCHSGGGGCGCGGGRAAPVIQNQ